MTYFDFIKLLKSHAEEEFAAFQRRLIFTKYEILGVRTPTLRKLAKQFEGRIEEIFSYPNDYYETVFIKLAIVAALPYEEFVSYVEPCVKLMDNWALCDCFCPQSIAKRRVDFLPRLEALFCLGEEFAVRFVLVTLLKAYVFEEHLPLIRGYLQRTDTAPYYVRMVAAWLTAEILIQRYDEGVRILREGLLEPKTQNKAIQKAIESYRLTSEQKEQLRSLKIKKR